MFSRRAFLQALLATGVLAPRAFGSAAIDPAGISEINQELDLWRAVLNSKFKLFGEPVSVTTAVHPEHDLLAVVINSRLPRLAFTSHFHTARPQCKLPTGTNPTNIKRRSSRMKRIKH